MSKTNGILLKILVFPAALIFFGTMGYRSLEENWSIADAFYMTVVTISTVGFAEIHPLSDTGRIFTVLLIFLGLFAISVIGAQAARLLIDNEMKNVLGRMPMKKEIKKLRDHYIVCGYGRIGSVICTELAEAAVPFVIIEREEILVDQADAEGYKVLQGDATTDHVLHEAGIDRAHGVVAALTSDADNLFISLAAREINPAIKIIARGEESGIENRMLLAGANTVVSPLKLGGRQIAHMILDEMTPHAPTAPTDCGEITLHQIRADNDLHKTVDELVHQANAMLAVAIRHADGHTEMMPSGNATLAESDTLFVCQRSEA